MSRTALGWRPHSGWAVLVVVGEPASSPSVLHRRRIELVESPLPRQPYHAIVEGKLPMRAAISLIAHVEAVSTAAALASIELARQEYAIEAVGVVGRQRSIPDDLERILASHALLHAAEGQLFERALVAGAGSVGLPVSLVQSERIEIGQALEMAGKVLGPPWQKDHKFAAAAALAALDA